MLNNFYRTAIFGGLVLTECCCISSSPSLLTHQSLVVVFACIDVEVLYNWALSLFHIRTLVLRLLIRRVIEVFCVNSTHLAQLKASQVSGDRHELLEINRNWRVVFLVLLPLVPVVQVVLDEAVVAFVLHDFVSLVSLPEHILDI